MPRKKTLDLKKMSANVLMVCGMVSAIAGSAKTVFEVVNTMGCATKMEAPAPPQGAQVDSAPMPAPPAPSDTGETGMGGPSPEEQRQHQLQSRPVDEIPIREAPTEIFLSREVEWPWIRIFMVVIGLLSVGIAVKIKRRLKKEVVEHV